jgi:heat shock protein HslJ
MNPKWISSLILVLLVSTAAGCGAQDTPKKDQGEVMTVFVGPELVDCEGEGPQKCMLVKENQEDDWHLFYDQIDGFYYEEGHNYEIVVRVENIPNPPAGGSSIRWALVDVISKTPVEKATGTSSLEGTLWVMEEYRDSEGNLVPSLPEITVTVEFLDGKVSGSSGCNSYSGSYEVNGDRIEFGLFASTMMACPEPQMELESGVLSALGSSIRFEVNDSSLTLMNDSGEVLVRFSASEPGSITSMPWEVLRYNNGKDGFASVILHTSITASFAEDGTLSGSAGCNNYNTQYEIGGASITIGPIALTQMFCSDPEGIMEQEAQYLAALQNATTYTIKLDQLNLLDAEGTRMVTYVARAEDPGVSGELDGEFGIEILENLDYKTTMTSSGTAQLQDGEYHEQIAEGSASETVVSLTTDVAYGEFDGSKAAAAILATTTGGSGTFYELALIQVQDGMPVNVATTFLGDRVKILSLQIQDDRIIVELIAQGPDDPMCCPTQWLRKTFEYEGGNLIETSAEELGKVSAPELLGETWMWVRFVDPIEAYDVANPEDYTMEFMPDDTVILKADCNMANGVYAASNGEIDIEILMTTLAMCTPDSLGDTFIAQLNEAARYFFEGSSMFYDIPVDSGTMEFERGR